MTFANNARPQIDEAVQINFKRATTVNKNRSCPSFFWVERAIQIRSGLNLTSSGSLTKMSDLCSRDSDSDVGSESSWTLLDEEKTGYGQTQTDPYTDDELDEELEAPVTTDIVEEVYVEESGEEEVVKGAELQLDRWESVVERRPKRKRRVDVAGLMLMAGAFLGLLSIAFICMVLPRGPPATFVPRYRPEAVLPHAARNAGVFMGKGRRHFEERPPLRKEVVPQHCPTKTKETSLMGQLYGAGKRLSDKVFRYTDGEKKDGNSSSSSGFFFKTNIYLALHILNDLVLLKATSRLRKDVEQKIRMLKKRTPVKRCRKLLRYIPRRLSEAARKRKATNSNYFDFLQEMQRMRDRKRELLKSLNLKARKQYRKEEKESRRLDKAYLNNTYDKVTSDPTLREQLMFCLSYLHARKRDFSTLIGKMELSDIVVQSPKYKAFLDKLVRLEEEIVGYFTVKSSFVECGTASRPNCEIGTVIDFLLARQHARLAKKDASTERYNVPIKSKTDIAKPDATAKLEWPISTIVLEPPTTALVPIEAEKKLSKEKLEVLKSWKDKYEQLKLFWKSRQEYYDKRVEICKMIKKIIPPEDGDAPMEDKKDLLDTSADLIDNVLNDIKMAFKQSATKTDVNGAQLSKPVNLYQKLFERKAQQVQKVDERRWQLAKYPKLGEEVLSKQDPSNVHRERVVRK